MENAMQQMKVRYSDCFTVECAGGTATVQFEFHILPDMGAIETLCEDLHALVDKHGFANLMLDLTGVQFLSSQVLGTMVSLQRQTAARGGSIVLSGVAENIARMLSITRLDTLLTVRPQSDTGPWATASPGCCCGIAGRYPHALAGATGQSGPLHS
jgi:anti-anti-sigma factor